MRWFLPAIAGFTLGLLAYPIALHLGGLSVVDRTTMELLERQVQELQDENNDLFEELLSPRANDEFVADVGDLPYDAEMDARQAFDEARDRAQNDGKFLMVTFGANWCPDCRNLHRHLNSDVVRSYAA